MQRVEGHERIVLKLGTKMQQLCHAGVMPTFSLQLFINVSFPPFFPSFHLLYHLFPSEFLRLSTAIPSHLSPSLKSLLATS